MLRGHEKSLEGTSWPESPGWTLLSSTSGFNRSLLKQLSPPHWAPTAAMGGSLPSAQDGEVEVRSLLTLIPALQA